MTSEPLAEALQSLRVTPHSPTPPPRLLPAPTHALLVPDICAAVFAQLVRGGDAATLATAARVCRVWFELAARELWRVPPRRAFAYAGLRQGDDGDGGDGGSSGSSSGSSEEARCRLVYGPAVQVLDVPDIRSVGSRPFRAGAGAAWRFPNVRAMSYTPPEEDSYFGTLADVLGRCGTRLGAVEVGWFSGWFACDAIDSMADNDNDNESDEKDDMDNTLERDESAKGESGGGGGVYVDSSDENPPGGGAPELVPDPCKGQCMLTSQLIALARREGLRVLEVREHMPRHAMKRCLRAFSRGASTALPPPQSSPSPSPPPPLAAPPLAAAPFAQLCGLAVHLCGTEVATLVRLLTAAPAPLSILNVHIIAAKQARPRFLAPLARLRRLRELRIEWYEWHRLGGAQLAALGALPPELRVLRLVDDSELLGQCVVVDEAASEGGDVGGGGGGGGALPLLADEHLLAVVARLPNLVELALMVARGFSRNALRLIGENCCALRRLEVNMPFAVAELERTALPVLFPHLEDVQVACVCLGPAPSLK